MSSRKILTGVALMALWAGVSAGAAHAQTATDAPIATDAMGGDIIVFGAGQVRQTATVNDQIISIATPGTSGLKAIERLPGVSFQSADPLGNYEWSARISIRGFNQNQLGFTLDGVPLGDMSYGNHNGLHVSRAVISENLAEVEVAQGSGALGTASSSNLGGTVQFSQRAPADEMGLSTAVTAGTDNTYRGYVRGDLGALPGMGLKAAISYAYQTADKWKGDGEQKQQQLNLSAEQPVGAGKLTGFVNWSERRENDYQDMSLDMLNRLGRDWDNISNNWALMQQVPIVFGTNPTGDAPTCAFTPGDGSNVGVYPLGIGCFDDAYVDASGLRDDLLSSIKFDYPITENIDVSAQVYNHQNEGQGLWYTPYAATPLGAPDASGNPISNPSLWSVRTTEYDINRSGLLGRLTWRVGAHELEAGAWYEDNGFNQARRFYGLRLDAPGRDSLKFQRDPFFTQWEYDFDTKTTLYYVQDTWDVTDQLTLFGGFKSLTVKNKAKPVVGTISGEIEANEDFLPQVGATYKVTPDHQVFVSFSENMRAFQAAATTGPFSTTQAGFNAIKDTLKPETSQTVEGGWRFRFGPLQGSLAAYHVKFDDRLLSVGLGAAIIGAPSALQNVGAVESKGVELAALWKIAPDWTAFASYTYNDSQYKDDVLGATGAVIAAIDGKTVVDTPENLIRGELAYDNGSLFGKVSAAFTDERYFTYTNDQSVDSYTTVDLSAGYRFMGMEGPLNGLEIQANVTNLLDEDFVSTIGSGGFGNSGDNMTLLPGAPRSVFVTVRKSF